MGWSYCHRPEGKTDLQWFREDLWRDPEYQKRLIDGSTYRGAFYGVYETEAQHAPYLVPGDNGMVRLALVILVKRGRGADGYNFGYKDMDETMGPCESQCPARILDQLSPYKEDATGYCKDWRARCRANLDARKARPALRHGLRVKLPTPAKFRDGRERDTFTVERIGTRTRFRGDDGALCDLPMNTRAQLVLA